MKFLIIELNKKKKIIGFLLILSFIFGSVQIICFSQQNLIISDRNGSSAEHVDNPKIAATIQPDWEIATGTSDTIAIVDRPSGTQDGDLLIFHGTIDGNGDSFNDPLGWNELLPEYSSNGITVALWYRIAGGSEPLTYNVSWGGGDEAYVVGIIRIIGYDRNDPFQTNNTAFGTGDIVNPSVTTTQDDTLIIGFHGRDTGIQGNNYGHLLEPGPTVLYANTSGGGGGMCSAGMYYEIQANQGASDERTWDVYTSGFNPYWYAATIAINSPASGIDIIAPTENEVFGDIAPNFTVEVKIPDLDAMWYTLDGGLNNYTFTSNETINQGAWDALSDGVVPIQFYANNTSGDIYFDQVNVIKDTSAPNITIISPLENEIFKTDPPSFIVDIMDLNLDTMWYSIFNTTYISQNRTFTVNGTIDSTEWNALYDGTYTIRFYANDSLGNVNFEEVNVIKDFDAIVINIVSPTENEVFGVSAPSFIVEFSDTNLNATWYTVDGGINIYIFTENETINQGAWGALSDGIVTIRFYANNTSGDIYFKQVNVIKNSSGPSINIISPTENEEFAINPPNFIVEIIDPNLDAMWYSIFNNTYSSLNITFTNNGTIDPTEWGVLSNGTYTLRFYANNSLGNINFEEVVIIKDIYGVSINIVSPMENDVFGAAAPSFIVEMASLYLDTMWYTLDVVPKNYIFTVNGTINQTAWGSLPDGVITIQFYANNTLGDIYFKQVNVIKDTTGPNINIVSPIENELFGVAAPSFTVEIADPYLDAMWYWIFNDTYQSINITFTGNGTINQAEWNAFSNGIISIRFYANDTIGNMNFEDVNVTKDIYAIFIDIISPIENQNFRVISPSFIVEITCAFLNSTWYSLDNGLHNYIFTENGTINQEAWDALPDGVVTIQFYANNTLGDINFEQVNVIKDTSDPIIAIVSPTENEVFEVEAPDFIVEIMDPNLDTMWYTVNNMAFKYIFTQNSTINQTIWDSLTDGNVLLIFYANDTAGNLASEYVIIIKSSPSQGGQTGPDTTLIIIIVSVIAGIAAVGVTLGILIKKGKIKLFSLREKDLIEPTPEESQ